MDIYHQKMNRITWRNSNIPCLPILLLKWYGLTFLAETVAQEVTFCLDVHDHFLNKVAIQVCRRLYEVIKCSRRFEKD